MNILGAVFSTPGVGVEVWFCGRGGGRLESCALHPNAHQLLVKIWAAAEEELMVVSATVLSRCQPSEAIQIDLSLKRSQLALTEESVIEESKRKSENEL
jgi:hypothetical protein